MSARRCPNVSPLLPTTTDLKVEYDRMAECVFASVAHDMTESIERPLTACSIKIRSRNADGKDEIEEAQYLFTSDKISVIDGVIRQLDLEACCCAHAVYTLD